jgi:hypothetical protein
MASEYTVALVGRLESIPGALLCYTDGAKKMAFGSGVIRPVDGCWDHGGAAGPADVGRGYWAGEGGGSGCVIWWRGSWIAQWGVPLGRTAESFAAELYAIMLVLKGVLYIRDPSQDGEGVPASVRALGASESAGASSVHVVGDNQATIVAAITGTIPAQPCHNLKLTACYSTMASINYLVAAIARTGCRVLFHWGPGHAGGAGNDRADRQAEAAALTAVETNAGAEVFATPFRTAKNVARRRAVMLWRTRRLRAATWMAHDTFFESTIRWTGVTRNWCIPFSDDGGYSVEDRWRHHPWPLTRSTCRDIEIVVARIRMFRAPTNSLVARIHSHLGLSADCGCGSAPGANWNIDHELFECPDTQPARVHAIPALRVLFPSLGTDDVVVSSCFTWRVLILHDPRAIEELGVELDGFLCLPPAVTSGLSTVFARYLRVSGLLVAWRRSIKAVADTNFAALACQS